jgi:preprotein translocase subunit Sec63
MKIIKQLRKDLNIITNDYFKLALHYVKSDKIHNIMIYDNKSFIIVDKHYKINTAYKLVEKFLKSENYL